jgi:hypothetical protein
LPVLRAFIRTLVWQPRAGRYHRRPNYCVIRLPALCRRAPGAVRRSDALLSAAPRLAVALNGKPGAALQLASELCGLDFPRLRA